MGFDEARVRDLAATALEQAIVDGRLTPGARGFRRARDEIAGAALLDPWEGDPRRSCLQAVHAERLDRWVKRGSARGSAERDAIIEPVLPLLAAAPAIVDPVAVRAALEPVLWLLDGAASGIAPTQTGALNRALVREVATCWPSWWPADLFGAPNREDDVTLHDATADYTSSLASHVYPAIIAAGWHGDGQPPEREHVSWAIADLLRPAEALCLLEPAPGDTRLRSGPLILSEIGRAALTDALRARALAPVHGPY